MKKGKTNSSLVWVAILIGLTNSVLLVVLLFHFSSRSESLDDQIEALTESQNENRSGIEVNRTNLERLYSEIAGLRLSRAEPERWFEFPQVATQDHGASYPDPPAADSYDSYVVYEEECVAEGKGLIGLFINLYSKCPDVILGYEINIQQQ